MRRTTKIFIGSILFIFVLIIGSIFYLSYLEKENNKIKYALGSELQSIDIPKAKVVYIDSLARIDNNYLYLGGKITLHNEQQGKNQLHINKQIASFTIATLRGDTLFITFDEEKIFGLFSQSKLKSINLHDTHISLPVDSTAKIISGMSWLNADISGLKMKELDVQLTSADFLIQNNDIGTLTTQVNSGNYRDGSRDYYSRNNTIDTCNLILNGINANHLSIKDCRINTLNYIGVSGHSGGYWTENNRAPITNSKHVNWYPQFEGQELNLILSDTTSIIQER